MCFGNTNDLHNKVLSYVIFPFLMLWGQIFDAVKTGDGVPGDCFSFLPNIVNVSLDKADRKRNRIASDDEEYNPDQEAKKRRKGGHQEEDDDDEEGEDSEGEGAASKVSCREENQSISSCFFLSYSKKVLFVQILRVLCVSCTDRLRIIGKRTVLFLVFFPYQ